MVARRIALLLMGHMLFLTETVQSADLDIGFPRECTCEKWIRSVYSGAEFEMSLPERGQPGGGGACTLRAYLMEDEICPSEPNCFSTPRILAIRTLIRTSVLRQPECRISLFPPVVLPFINNHSIGPYSRGQRVDVHVDWFTSNLDRVSITSGPLQADLSRLGVHIHGIIPSDEKENLYDLVVSNRWGTRSIRFLLQIK